MARKGTIVGTITDTSSREDIKELGKNLAAIASELPNLADDLLHKDALAIAEEIKAAYVGDFDSKSVEDKKRSKPINVDVFKIEGGWNIIANGPNLLYREFGTGQLGADNPYPDESILRDYNWKYGSGDNVIVDGEYINRNDNDNRAPEWYFDALEKGKVDPNSYTWYGPYGISTGISPRLFWWNSWNEYESEQLEEGEYSIGHARYSLTPRQLKVQLKSKINLGRWED